MEFSIYMTSFFIGLVMGIIIGNIMQAKPNKRSEMPAPVAPVQIEQFLDKMPVMQDKSSKTR